jgi:transcriptional repressor NF-X1
MILSLSLSLSLSRSRCLLLLVALGLNLILPSSHTHRVCHPGPCPPCSSMGNTIECFCGSTTYRLRCGEEAESMSCGEICDKPLACNRHRCQQICHTGECDSCQVQEQQQCYCGAVTGVRACGSAGERDCSSGSERSFSCNTPCGKALTCGNHFCTRPCHAGACAPCHDDVQLVRTCPCGSATLQELQVTRTSCLDAVPTCTNTCAKLLQCAQHTCAEKCHIGACPPCTAQVQVMCRCGESEQSLACSVVHSKPPSVATDAAATDPQPPWQPFELLCDRRCTFMRACGRHRCDTNCCPLANIAPQLSTPKDGVKPNSAAYQSQIAALASSLHTCPLICNRQLPCKQYGRNSHHHLTIVAPLS